ncbi:endochitinase A [Triticum aestivum]|uniref:endochitinase A n=1 Tax=Triticum aestivum TaxID=4565 RepID=UPI001D02CDFE|nr:endochitinase A-like [Triticum aestivum]
MLSTGVPLTLSPLGPLIRLPSSRPRRPPHRYPPTPAATSTARYHSRSSSSSSTCSSRPRSSPTSSAPASTTPPHIASSPRPGASTSAPPSSTSARVRRPLPPHPLRVHGMRGRRGVPVGGGGLQCRLPLLRPRQGRRQIGRAYESVKAEQRVGERNQAMASKSRQVPTVVALVRQSAASERCRSQVLGMSPRLTKMPRLQVLGMSPRRPTSSTSSEFPKCLTPTATACTTRRMMASSLTPAPSSPTPGRGPVHDIALPLLLLLPTVTAVADWSMHGG